MTVVSIITARRSTVTVVKNNRQSETLFLTVSTCPHGTEGNSTTTFHLYWRPCPRFLDWSQIAFQVSILAFRYFGVKVTLFWFLSRYHQLDISQTLKSCLNKKTIIEFPTLHVVLHEKTASYPTGSQHIDDVCAVWFSADTERCDDFLFPTFFCMLTCSWDEKNK